MFYRDPKELNKKNPNSYNNEDGSIVEKMKSDNDRTIYRTNYPFDLKPANEKDFFKMLEGKCLTHFFVSIAIEI